MYSLELSGDDVPSGLFAVDASAPLGKGEQIVLNQLGNVITGSAGGVAYFTLTIDPVSGEVTLELLDNLWHDDTADADDSEVLALAEGALLLTQTVTDGDGDSEGDEAKHGLVAQGIIQQRLQGDGQQHSPGHRSIASQSTSASASALP